MDRDQTLRDVQAFMDMVPFNAVVGIRIDALEDGLARMYVPFREDLIGDPFRRAIHGGVISTLVDTCGGAALWTQCDSGDRLSTVDLRVDYLRPGQPETLYVQGRVVRLGNRVGVTSMEVYHAGGQAEPIATGTAVYNVKRQEP